MIVHIQQSKQADLFLAKDCERRSRHSSHRILMWESLRWFVNDKKTISEHFWALLWPHRLLLSYSCLLTVSVVVSGSQLFLWLICSCLGRRDAVWSASGTPVLISYASVLISLLLVVVASAPSVFSRMGPQICDIPSFLLSAGSALVSMWFLLLLRQWWVICGCSCRSVSWNNNAFTTAGKPFLKQRITTKN